MLDTKIRHQDCIDVGAAYGLAADMSGVLAPFRELAGQYKAEKAESGLSDLQAEAARFVALTAETAMLEHYREEALQHTSRESIGDVLQSNGEYKKAAAVKKVIFEHLNVA